MKNFLKYISLELAVVFTIFIIGWAIQFHEIVNVLNTEIGWIISTFGILWLITGFFRIVNANNWGYFFLSLVCSFGLVLFGVILSLWGIGYAFIALPIYFLLVFSPIGHYLDPNIPYLKIMAISLCIGLFFLILSCTTHSKYFKGTKQFDRTELVKSQNFEKSKTNKDSVWYIECEIYDEKSGMKEKDIIGSDFTGTYDDAIKYGKTEAKKFCSENKNKIIFEDTIKPITYVSMKDAGKQ